MIEARQGDVKRLAIIMLGVEISARVNRRIAVWLFICCLFAYAYFFQGTGWNQNAHFDTVRAIVERGDFDITDYAANTGDVSRLGERVFSNKPPGLPLLGAPTYWLATNVERPCGVNINSPNIVIANMHLTTIAVSAMPGALIILAIYQLFRRESVPPARAVMLAIALAFGSLIWPYSGVMMSHMIVTASLVWAWLFVSDRSVPLTRRDVLAAGLLVATAGMSDYFAAPLAGLFFAYLVIRRAGLRDLAIFCIGPVVVGIAVSLMNYRSFGHVLTTTYSFEDSYFKRPGMLFGQFHLPEFERLYWISYHRMRGLFVCCPMFIVPVFSVLAWRPRLRITVEQIVPLMIVAYFVMFILTFLGWTGGWGVGPRYLIPGLPFLWLYARRGYGRFRAISLIVIALSILTMLTITSVQVLYPANDSGPPTHWDPVSFAWLAFARGQLAKSPSSYNLGMLVGLTGLASLIPLVIGVGLCLAMIWRYLSAARASESAAAAQRLYIPAEGCNPSAATSDLNSRDSGVTST